ncbi:hypothetical protein [Methylogaea oryzae]|uniref:DUF1496 domain-containing protein n=1 Tax=Methylogaea oryzae TaxID=1295382 RepID=A0A8D5AKR7_9GAMM|nr:hypothetical protein [Methylogaea oryzae]BBL72089.1 hypothetical protein MoryE10_26950 [Methylogaea oryzae]
MKTLLVLSLLFAAAVHAASAPWYLWQSKVDGSTFCAQKSPGPGWVKLKGPFYNAGCELKEPPANLLWPKGKPERIDLF